MAPRAKKTLEDALARATADVFGSDERDQLSVNLVRKRVEADLGLGDGYFRDEAEWKARSKDVIMETVEKLNKAEENGELQSSQVSGPAPDEKRGSAKRGSPERDEEEGSPVKKKAKRQRPAPAAASKARGKKKAAPSKESSSELSDISAPEEEEEDPEPAKKPTKRGRKRNASPASVSEDDDGEGDFEEGSDAESDPSGGGYSDGGSSEDESPAKKKRKGPAAAKSSKQKKVAPKKEATPDAGEESPLSDVKDVQEDDDKEESEKEAPAEDDESELSEVIDEPPKPKRKSKEPSGKAAPKRKGAKPKQAAELSPDEAEIKKLQGQLVKCGVRKIWGVELKKYGDDAKGKIRHLRGMLSDVGMEGRFSEAKAKEIKERKELQADLEALQQMDKNWGVASGRTSRSRANQKSLKELSDEEESGKEEGNGDGGEDDEDEESDGEPAKTMPRARGSARYRADLAFLGSESESGSD